MTRNANLGAHYTHFGRARPDYFAGADSRAADEYEKMISAATPFREALINVMPAKAGIQPAVEIPGFLLTRE